MNETKTSEETKVLPMPKKFTHDDALAEVETLITKALKGNDLLTVAHALELKFKLLGLLY